MTFLNHRTPENMKISAESWTTPQRRRKVAETKKHEKKLRKARKALIFPPKAGKGYPITPLNKHTNPIPFHSS